MSFTSRRQMKASISRYSVASKHVSDHIKRTRRGSRISRFFIHDPNEPYQVLEALDSTEQVFVTRVLPDDDDDTDIDNVLTHLFSLLDSSGEIMFTLLKSFHYENCDILLQLDLSVLDPNGGGLMAVKGDSVNLVVCHLSTQGALGATMGRIYCPQKKYKSKKPNLIYVQDLETGEKFTISSSVDDIPGEMVIKCTTTTKGPEVEDSNRGRISKDWSDEFGEYSQLGSLYGIRFPRVNMKVSTKATLMGAFILMYFKTFDQDEQHRRGIFDCSGIICCVYGIVLFVLICGMSTAILLAYYVDGLTVNL